MAKLDLKAVYSLLELVSELTVGPLNMQDIKAHTVKNAAGFAALACLLTLSISVFSGGIDISFLGAGFLSVITSSVVAFIGFFANLLIPLPAARGGDAAYERNTNKFVTYAIISFIMTVFVFVFTGALFLLFGRHVTSLVDWLTVEHFWTYANATKVVSLLCASVGTTLLYGALFFAKRLYASGTELITYFLLTILICSVVFYASHFVFFS